MFKILLMVVVAVYDVLKDVEKGGEELSISFQYSQFLEHGILSEHRPYLRLPSIWLNIYQKERTRKSEINASKNRK